MLYMSQEHEQTKRRTLWYKNLDGDLKLGVLVYVSRESSEGAFMSCSANGTSELCSLYTPCVWISILGPDGRGRGRFPDAS
jgi:hypothetical protein